MNLHVDPCAELFNEAGRSCSCSHTRRVERSPLFLELDLFFSVSQGEERLEQCLSIFQLTPAGLCSRIISLVYNCQQMQSCVLIAVDETGALMPHRSLIRLS